MGRPEEQEASLVIEEAIWTSGAADDYLRADSILASSDAIDAVISLVRLFPEMGSRVPGTDRIRRVLVGRRRFYGLYHSVVGNRLIVVALLDLRQDPDKIEGILRERGIQ